ncbi:hypothetical protein AURANDRAFT_16033, partial [Aureococcus anophagefferens]
MKSLSRRFTLKSHSVELKGEEIEELRRSFAAADLDQSGTLDQEEIYKVLSAHAKISEAQASKLMEDADADKSGALDFEEFLEVIATSRLKKNAGSWWRSWLPAVFREIDEDRSGFIDKTEMQACLKRLGAKATAKEAARVLKVADLDGNGVLDFDEFL